MFSLQTAPFKMLIPEQVQKSPLLKKGGFDVFEGLVDEKTFALLISEATQQFDFASENQSTIPDHEALRGGTPPRRFLIAQGGMVQDAFYQSPGMLDFLRQQSGLPVSRTGIRGTYSYYYRPGDYLALHRDIVTCDLAVISCLQDNTKDISQGGMLVVYPERIQESLTEIRKTLHQGAMGLRLKPGQTIVLMGGIVPHAVLPMGQGEKRIVSVLCYRLLTAS